MRQWLKVCMHTIAINDRMYVETVLFANDKFGAHLIERNAAHTAYPHGL